MGATCFIVGLAIIAWGIMGLLFGAVVRVWPAILIGGLLWVAIKIRNWANGKTP